PALEPLRSAHDTAVHTRQRYRLAELEDKACRAGLDVVRATYANTLLFPLAAASRVLARLHNRRGMPGEPDGDAHVRSDVRPVPALLNAALATVLRVEAALLGRLDLPVGLSAVILARRPLDRVRGPKSEVRSPRSEV